MKDQRKTEIKVGVTVLAGIIIFLWIFGWAKNFSPTSTEKNITVKFGNVSGLEIGDDVTVNGVRKGHVEDITSKGNSVFVKLGLENNVNLRSDVTFAISMVDMMGGKKVEIKPGISAEPLDYGKVQQGTFYADIPEVMSLVGSMESDIQQTLANVKQALTSLNSYLADKKLQENIKTTAENLSALTEKLNQVLEENRKSIKIVASNSAELTNEAKQFISDNKKNVSASISEVSSVLKSTDSLLVKMNEFADETRAKKNNIGKIMYDEKMYDNHSQSVKQIKILTQVLIEQLKAEGVKVDAHISLF